MNPLLGPPALLWVYNLAGEQVAVTGNPLDLTLDTRLDSSAELGFAIRADDPAAVVLNPDSILRYNEESFWRVTELDQERTGALGSLVVVTGEALWYELGDYVHIGNFFLGAVTAAEGLQQIIGPTKWTVGTVPTELTLFSIERVDQTALTLVREWAALTGYELDFDTTTRTVNMVPQVGADRGAGFLYGRNVTAIRRRIEQPEATVLWPFGANDLTIAGSNPTGLDYVENFDWYVSLGLTLEEARQLHTRTQVWVDSRFLGSLALYDAAVTRLQELAYPTISYEAAVVDLTDQTGIPEDYELGDTVKVTDELLGIDLTTRVVRLVKRPLEPAGDEVELSFLRPTTTGTGGTSSNARESSAGKLAVLIDEVEDSIIADTTTAWARIQLNVAGTATIVTGATFVAQVIPPDPTVWELYMAVDGETIGAPIYLDSSNAVNDELELSWPSYAEDLTEGSHTVEWIVRRLTGTGAIALNAGDARAWLLTQGAVGIGFGGSASQQITETIAEVTPDTLTASATIAPANALPAAAGETVTEITPDALTDNFLLEIPAP